MKVSDDSDRSEDMWPSAGLEVIWVDEEIKKKEYKSYLSELEDSFDSVVSMESVEAFERYRKNVQKEGKYTVIVSGGLGEEIAKRLYDDLDLLFIIVFCSNVSLHSKWAKNYKKISDVVSRFSIVIEKIQRMQRIHGRNVYADD